MGYIPVEVRLVLVYVDVVERVHAQPGVEGKAVLVRPFGYWRQRYRLVRREKG